MPELKHITLDYETCKPKPRWLRRWTFFDLLLALSVFLVLLVPLSLLVLILLVLIFDFE